MFEEALEILEKKKRSERQRRKGKIYPFKCRVPKNSKERVVNNHFYHMVHKKEEGRK